MSQPTYRSAFSRIAQSAFLVIALTACATEGPPPGSLEALKQSQFMPIYQQCIRDRAPPHPRRTSTVMLNEAAKACMRAANRAVR
jgi:hypothetical protein